ncbi:MULTISPECIES: cytochrome b [Chromobacterium]|uniref:Cytochrome b n=1 Tax=Chromobacterium haemolyticum TaxID=394935 RepID=A0A1W0CNG5_9NEIS|nr:MULTISPECIES: cytochrome b [Chromobacterium]MBK0413314.1 cytochrome b [Chromobacterium haemolyticum]MBO0414416.1 cytochrome b [Chromobacterium haemolyticum]MBO0497725.1 cytochrome b [Chromobacterium haemolyticum]MDH0340029.1 cytochrome b [Chromobacterium haemolyticum]OQS36208.1 cytochrome b [Chromobacterium haemolyticum]
MQRYSPTQIALHWLIALLIIAALIMGWYFNSMQITSPASFKLKASLIAWHKWVGISVLALAVLRLIWRARRGAPAPLPGQPAWQLKAAGLIHLLLYALMLAMPLVGWLMSSAKGYPVVWFNLVQLPDLVEKNEALGHVLGWSHALMAYAIVAIVGLHALAALKHHFIDRDATLARMLPSCRKGDPQA